MPVSRQALTNSHGISSAFWEELFLEANSYFAPYEHRNEAEDLIRFDTELRYLCKRKSKVSGERSFDIPYFWEKMAFFSSWRGDSSSMLCFDLPESMQDDIVARVRQTSIGPSRSPFFALDLAVAAVVVNFDLAVWEWRDSLRKIEKTRPNLEETTMTKANYIKMHELSRHIIHSNESLTSAIETTATMIDTLRRLDMGKQPVITRQSVLRPEQGLVKEQSMMKCLLGRSKALESRLTGEINLVR